MIKENLRTLEDMQRESKVVSELLNTNQKTTNSENFLQKFKSHCLHFVPRKNAYKFIGSIKPLTSTTYEKGYKSNGVIN